MTFLFNFITFAAVTSISWLIIYKNCNISPVKISAGSRNQYNKISSNKIKLTKRSNNIFFTLNEL